MNNNPMFASLQEFTLRADMLESLQTIWPHALAQGAISSEYPREGTNLEESLHVSGSHPNISTNQTFGFWGEVLVAC